VPSYVHASWPWMRATRAVSVAVAGRGLLGMQERVAAFGGDVEAGALPEGGFAVRARLPMEIA
jgi:signal transduction histidine kinase